MKKQTKEIYDYIIELATEKRFYNLALKYIYKKALHEKTRSKKREC